jgi:hypothetical protein
MLNNVSTLDLIEIAKDCRRNASPMCPHDNDFKLVNQEIYKRTGLEKYFEILFKN